MDLDVFMITVCCWTDKTLPQVTGGQWLCTSAGGAVRQRGACDGSGRALCAHAGLGTRLGYLSNRILRVVLMHTRAVHFYVQRRQPPLHLAARAL